MNLIPVTYSLKIGHQNFIKQIFVNFVPSVGNYLKIVNSSFVVREVEQDLDSYHEKFYENGMACDSVRAEINEVCHDESDHLVIVNRLLQTDWRESKLYF